MKAEALKGHLDGLILAVVAAGPAHGYAIIEDLKARSGGAFALPEGTVYPALHRLERAGLVRGRSEPRGRRPRRVYDITDEGEAALEDWLRSEEPMPFELRDDQWQTPRLRDVEVQHRIAIGCAQVERSQIAVAQRRSAVDRNTGRSGRLRRRILAELADHLACDPDADLGPPRALARQFADELGTSRSRRAAFAGFAALGVAGVAYAVAFVASAGMTATQPHSRVIGWLAAAALVVAPQIAFVAGALALLRALRRRRDCALPAQEVQVLVRRTGVALAAGLGTMGAVALSAHEYGAHAGIAYAAAAIGGGALLLAAPSALAAARIRPAGAGDAGDVFADLGALVPERLRGDARRLARAVAAAVGLAVWAAGIVQGDPIDGLIRGVAEALACLGGFAVLGRFLGLRPRS